MFRKFRNSENLEKSLLLLYLFGFVTISIFVVNALKNPEGKSVIQFGGVSQGSSSLFASNLNLDPQRVPITDLEDDDPANSNVQHTSQVQGAATGGCEDQNPQGCQSDLIAFQPVCTEVNAGVDLVGGSAQQNGNSVTVNKNSVIEIWKVTAPLAVLSGKEEITDSTYAITRTDPVFRSAGNMIDKDLVAGQFFAPGEDRESLDQVYNEADTKDFSVHVSAAFGGDGVTSTDEATILPELESKCSDIQPSDPNPDRTNKVAGEISQSYTVPGQPLQPRSYSDPENPSCLVIDPAEIDLPNSDVYETCVNQRSPFDGIIGSVISVGQWAQCLADEASCEEIELVGLMIDAPFGSNQNCNDGFCADQYFDTTVASGISPNEIGDYIEPGFEDAPEAVLKTHFVTTPCKVRIDYKDIYDIPCLWDISPYRAQYDLEASKVRPGDPDFPSWEEYWDMVEAESERRGSFCGF